MGPAEILVILVFAFIIIGPEKLPKLGTTIGKAIRQFRGMQDQMNDTLKKTGIDPEKASQAISNPFQALENMGKSDSAAEKKTIAAAGAIGSGSASVTRTAGSEPASASGATGSGLVSSRDTSTSKPIAAVNVDASEIKQAEAHTARVEKIPDKETFTERKIRLASERERSAPKRVEASEGKEEENPE